MKRYPRDMSGYGPTPPAAQWPGGAKIAVQLVLNYLRINLEKNGL